MKTIERVVYRVADRLVAGRYWAWRVGLIAMLLSAIHALPPYDLPDDNHLPGSPANTNRLKGLHPLTHFGFKGPSSHEAKIDFRFVAPLVLRPFHSTFVSMVALYAACGIIVYALIAREIVRGGLTRRIALLTSSGLAVTAAGGTFLLGYQYFDALAIALALGATTTRRYKLLCGVLAWLALFTDERAVIALALGVAVSRFIDHRRAYVVGRGLTWRSLALVTFLYGVTRIALEVSTELRSESAEVGLAALRLNAARLPIGLIMAYGAWWVLFGFAVWLLGSRRGVVLASLAIIPVASATLVDDVTRSLVYLLPFAPSAVAILSDQWTSLRAERVVLWTGVVCALTPAIVMVGPIGHFNPLPVHIVRWAT